MSKGGRPSKYDPAMCKQARRLCLLGATDKDLAEFFEVSEDTINAWKKEHSEFSESLKEAKGELDAKVVRRLFERAIGYSHPDVHLSNYQGAVTQTPITKHYAPDVTAAIFWLKNRQSEQWRDRVEHTGKDGGPIETLVTDADLARWLAFETAGRVIAKAREKA